jgi:hypothetical protein
MAGTDARWLLKWAATDNSEALRSASLGDVDCTPAATVAVQRGNRAALEVLFDRGAVPPDVLSELASVAVILGHHGVLEAFAAHADEVFSSPDNEGKTLAFLAASAGDLTTLKIIATVAPVTLGLPIRGGGTPVDVAWHRGHDVVVAWFGSMGIPDPTERWQSCCEGEPCGPKPVRGEDSVVS